MFWEKKKNIKKIKIYRTSTKLWFISSSSFRKILKNSIKTSEWVINEWMNERKVVRWGWFVCNFLEKGPEFYKGATKEKKRTETTLLLLFIRTLKLSIQSIL